MIILSACNVQCILSILYLCKEQDLSIVITLLSRSSIFSPCLVPRPVDHHYCSLVIPPFFIRLCNLSSYPVRMRRGIVICSVAIVVVTVIIVVILYTKIS